MRYGENEVGQVRPASTFESFKPKTDSQNKALLLMQKVAEQLVEKRMKIVSERYPFDNAKMLTLVGDPGRGKTHLVEALVNYLRVNAPEILQKVFLSREDFAIINAGVMNPYGNCPVVILDDFFAERQSVEKLHDMDIQKFMEFVRRSYEERRLLIFTTNFPFQGGILKRVQKIDTTGRIVSRLTEILGNSGEIEVTGEDYRLNKAKSEFKV